MWATRPSESVASTQPVASALAGDEPVFTSAGAVVTQTFTLAAGWNAIYLEVEPINNSPLVNVGTADDPIMAPTLSTMEAVFAPVADGWRPGLCRLSGQRVDVEYAPLHHGLYY